MDLSKRRKNHRHHPGVKGRRPDNAVLRQQEAVERQQAYDQLSIEDRIDKLDFKLGKGVGASKQRARLAEQLEERTKPQPEAPKEVSQAENKNFNKKK